MSKRVNYGPWLSPNEEGKIWWTLDDAHKLVAGWKPVEDDDTQLSPKLTATSNRAVAGQSNLMAEFSRGTPPCQTIQNEADPELEASAGVKHLPSPFVDADCYLSWAVLAGYAIPAALRQAMDQKREEIEHTKAMYRNRVKELADKRFGYSDFIRDWQVENPARWFDFVVRPDGVYVAVPFDDDPLVSPRERAESSWHHEGDLTKPALRFPYTLNVLHDFVTAYKLESLIPSNELSGLMKAVGEIKSARDEAEFTAAFYETQYNGTVIDWRYWVHQMPTHTAAQAAHMMCGLDPDIFERLDNQSKDEDTNRVCRKAKQIQRLAEAKGMQSATPREWLEWADEHGLKVHSQYRLEVEAQTPSATDTTTTTTEQPSEIPAKNGDSATRVSARADFLALENLSASEVNIEFAAGDSGGVVLNVSAREVTRRMTLIEFDLFDHRKANMNTRGVVMLEWAIGGERVSASRRGMPKQIERLRKALKSTLGIIDNPIRHEDGIGYVPVFTITDRRNAADHRAKREAERRKESLEELQERGMQLSGIEGTDYSYETDEEMAGDSADKWLKGRGE